MSTQVPPMWKMRVNDCLRRSNKVNLSGENIDDLEKLGTVKLMVQLDLSYVRTIKSFEGLKPQPSLKTLIADGSTIASLKNISVISNITTLSLKNTPLTKSTQSFNLIASLLLVLPKLNIFNGKLISRKTREKVESAGYPMPSAAQLVNAGWIVEYPCPSKHKIIELLKSYDIYNEDEVDFEEEEQENLDMENEATEVQIEENNDDSIDENKNNDGHKRHNKNNDQNDNFEEEYDQDQNENNNVSNIYENEEDYPEYDNNNNANEYDDNEDEVVNEYNNSDNVSSNTGFNKNISEMSLLEKVVLVLKSNGYEVDTKNTQQSVLNIIDSLCSEMEQINSTLPPSEQSSVF